LQAKLFSENYTMANKLTAKASININVPVSKVWKALTDPVMIKEYLFGTNAVSEWQPGSSITYTGEWEGRPYEDKGMIIDMVPDRLLHTTYYSSMSGREDIPENYANVIYKISPDDGHSLLTITQDNIDSESQQQHVIENWGMVLEKIKKMLENGY
jgi:uncharacterized protein YndB with AHSA1/START domain